MSQKMDLIVPSQESIQTATTIIDNVHQHYGQKYFIYCLQKMIEQQTRLFQFISHHNQNNLEKLMNADKIQCDSKLTKLKSQKQMRLLKEEFSHLILRQSGKVGKKQQLKKKVSKGVYSTKADSRSKNKGSEALWEDNRHISNAVPLLVNDESQSSNDDQDEDTIKLFRQRKVGRELYKTRLIEAARQPKKVPQKFVSTYKKNDNKGYKKDKITYHPHYVDMEISVEKANFETDLDLSGKSKKRLYLNKKKKGQTKSLQVSPKKRVIINSVNTSHQATERQWQPLVTQDRQLVLQDPDRLKLSPGVTFREESYWAAGSKFGSKSTVRKKLGFLKNNEMNPVKIRLNELLSFKKLGTMTNMAYCSSMKTVKDCKQNGTCLSIESSQLLSEKNLNSRKLIKITNRRCYEELMGDSSSYNGELLKRSKFKGNNSAKVRFNNVMPV